MVQQNIEDNSSRKLDRKITPMEDRLYQLGGTIFNENDASGGTWGDGYMLASSPHHFR